MLKYSLIFKCLLAIVFIVISYLVFSRPSYSQSSFEHIDKVGHFGSFFALAWLAYGSFKPKWYWLTSALAAYAVLIEVIQGFIPYRSASFADFVADLAGVAAFYLALVAYHKIKHQFVQQGKK
ncbi:VanZ family protein [Parashewanella tropica]|uniref:VanZ family protein n=1 Tax=Parashewanella tropica TaxID=2547970 RepID=UPI0010596703|nr:VanZ family protein [Parashewanella tropica]